MDGGWPADDRAAEPRRARSRSPAREREIRDAPPPPREDRERSSYSGRDDRSALLCISLDFAEFVFGTIEVHLPQATVVLAISRLLKRTMSSVSLACRE